MNKIWSAIMHNPKKAILTLSAIVSGLIPVALNAWGPNRTEFTWNEPADYVVFNSITNNPTWGDEFNFVRIKEAGTANNFVDKIAVVPGKKYTVFALYHNNAATSLSLLAENVRMNTQLPTEIAAGGSAQISAKVMSSNANPQTVWDETSLTSTKNVTVKYVQNSATINNQGTINGSKLNQDDLFLGTGALLGYNALDGKILSCSKYSGYVTYDILIEEKIIPAPDFRIEKTVAVAGTTTYGEQVTVKDNTKVTFKIEYKNIGNTTQNNVVVKDTLPAGMTYVPGSSYLFNANTGGQLKLISDNIVTSNGINIGNYAAGTNAFVYFSARLNDQECGKTVNLTNTAKIITDDGVKTDNAQVTVKTEDCPVIIKKIDVCVLASKEVKQIDETAFDATKHSKNLDDCKPVVVKKIDVCVLASKEVKQIDETAFDATKHSKNLDDCKPVVVKKIDVCVLATKEVKNIDETAFDATKHSKNLDDCKPVVVKKIIVCRLSDKKYPHTIDETEFNTTSYSKNPDDCKTTPAELPKTGIASTFGQVIGLGSLVSSSAYYVSSKRQLK